MKTALYRISSNEVGKIVERPTLHSGTARAGSATTITLDLTASDVDGFFDDHFVIVDTGAGAVQQKKIESYVGATRVATILGADWSPVPDLTSGYKIHKNRVQLWVDRPTALFAVFLEPTTPDGIEVRDNSADQLGPLRQFGFAKIAEPGSNNIRNATQLEIDGFDAPMVDDRNQQDADRAGGLGDEDPHFRKIFKALLKGIVRENNIMATRYNELRAEVLASSNFNDMKTRVQNNTQDAPIRTNQQAFNALRPDTSKDD